jgi:hypothetical protein
MIVAIMIYFVLISLNLDFFFLFSFLLPSKEKGNRLGMVSLTQKAEIRRMVGQGQPGKKVS